MDPLQSIVEQTRAPIARSTIDEKIEIFERRLNGRILPFVGLHGTLIALIYAIDRTDLVSRLAEWGKPAPALLALAVAVLCGVPAFSFHRLGLGRDIAGGAAIACCLAMIGLLLSPLGAAGIAAAVMVYLVLLALNAFGRVDDYEINTVWIYLPFIFVVVGGLTGLSEILPAFAVYAPAIYVKFIRQPEANKLPLGFSILVYLAYIIDQNADSNALIAVVLVLVMGFFVVYAFRMRHLAGSSYRHFATDAIILGLWALFVGATLGDIGDNQPVVWGLGVAVYQGFLLTVLLVRKPTAERTQAERGARLAWLEIAALAVFGRLVAEDLFANFLGIEATYAAVLLIVAPFIPLFRILRSPFLALTTRLWVAGSLVAAVIVTQDSFESAYLGAQSADEAATLRAGFVGDIESTLALAVFALLVGLASTIQAGSGREPVWWRGLIRDRHMVLVRRGARLVIGNANRIAFVGGVISALAALFNWIRFAGSDRRGVSSRDVMLIAVHVYAVAMTLLIARYLAACCDAGAADYLRTAPLVFAAGDYLYVAACCAWGLVLYLQGVLRHDHLARFFATAFIAMPLVTYSIHNTLDDTGFLALVLLTCCFALFALGLLRRFAG